MTITKSLYKVLAADIIETIIFFNLVKMIFSTATLYTYETTQNQVAVAYTFVLVTCVTFLAIIIFHVYKYAGVYLLCQKIAVFRVASAKLHVTTRKGTGTAIQ